jgi:predicted GTPase
LPGTLLWPIIIMRMSAVPLLRLPHQAALHDQIKTRPPTFVLFAAKADDLPDAYARYLVNGIRERFDLQGTPIRLQLRRTDNPVAEKE